eukprot:g2985.t1
MTDLVTRSTKKNKRNGNEDHRYNQSARGETLGTEVSETRQLPLFDKACSIIFTNGKRKRKQVNRLTITHDSKIQLKRVKTVKGKKDSTTEEISPSSNGNPINFENSKRKRKKMERLNYCHEEKRKKKKQIIRVKPTFSRRKVKPTFSRRKVKSSLDVPKSSSSSKNGSESESNIDETLQKLEVAENFYCHICHSKKTKSIRRCSAFKPHWICTTCLIRRFNITFEEIEENDTLWSNCPVCEQTCPCAGCRRKHGAIIKPLQKATVVQKHKKRNSFLPKISKDHSIGSGQHLSALRKKLFTKNTSTESGKKKQQSSFCESTLPLSLDNETVRLGYALPAKPIDFLVSEVVRDWDRVCRNANIRSILHNARGQSAYDSVEFDALQSSNLAEKLARKFLTRWFGYTLNVNDLSTGDLLRFYSAAGGSAQFGNRSEIVTEQTRRKPTQIVTLGVKNALKNRNQMDVLVVGGYDQIVDAVAGKNAKILKNHEVHSINVNVAKTCMVCGLYDENLLVCERCHFVCHAQCHFPRISLRAKTFRGKNGFCSICERSSDSGVGSSFPGKVNKVVKKETNELDTGQFISRIVTVTGVNENEEFEYQARSVVVTASLGVMKLAVTAQRAGEENLESVMKEGIRTKGMKESVPIQFTPKLSDDLCDAFDFAPFGHHNKLIVEYNCNFWNSSNGVSRSSISTGGLDNRGNRYINCSDTRFGSILNLAAFGKQNMVCVHLFEPYVSEIANRSEEEVANDFDSVFRKEMFVHSTKAANAKIVRREMTLWHSEKSFLGSYSEYSGLTNDEQRFLLEEMRKPHANAIFFAGEHTATANGTVTGAYESGMRIGVEVIDYLQRSLYPEVILMEEKEKKKMPKRNKKMLEEEFKRLDELIVTLKACHGGKDAEILCQMWGIDQNEAQKRMKKIEEEMGSFGIESPQRIESCKASMKKGREKTKLRINFEERTLERPKRVNNSSSQKLQGRRKPKVKYGRKPKLKCGMIVSDRKQNRFKICNNFIDSADEIGNTNAPLLMCNKCRWNAFIKEGDNVEFCYETRDSLRLEFYNGNITRATYSKERNEMKVSLTFVDGSKRTEYLSIANYSKKEGPRNWRFTSAFVEKERNRIAFRLRLRNSPNDLEQTTTYEMRETNDEIGIGRFAIKQSKNGGLLIGVTESFNCSKNEYKVLYQDGSLEFIQSVQLEPLLKNYSTLFRNSMNLEAKWKSGQVENFGENYYPLSKIKDFTFDPNVAENGCIKYFFNIVYNDKSVDPHCPGVDIRESKQNDVLRSKGKKTSIKSSEISKAKKNCRGKKTSINSEVKTNREKSSETSVSKRLNYEEEWKRCANGVEDETKDNLYDVCVIGAGVSGLKAAEMLRKASIKISDSKTRPLKILHLEATQRIGGRVRTQRFKNEEERGVESFYDTGANYLHGFPSVKEHDPSLHDNLFAAADKAKLKVAHVDSQMWEPLEYAEWRFAGHRLNQGFVLLVTKELRAALERLRRCFRSLKKERNSK